MVWLSFRLSGLHLFSACITSWSQTFSEPVCTRRLGHVPQGAYLLTCFHQLLHGISGLIPVSFSFSLLSDHSSGLSSFPLQVVDATLNFKTNNGHGEASLNAEFSRLPDSSTYPVALTPGLPSVLPLFPLTLKVSVSLPATRFDHGGRRHLAQRGCNWGSTCSIQHLPLVSAPTPRNQKCFPNPKRPREWGLVKKPLSTRINMFILSLMH